jgi:hypothetical protein
MKSKIFTTIVFLLLNTSAFGSANIEQYFNRIEAYSKLQSLSSSRLVNFSDVNGGALKAILDPTLLASAMTDVKDASIPSQEKAIQMFDRFTEIVKAYAQAFKDSPKQYEAEFLEAFETNFMVMVAMMHQPMNFDETTAPEMRKLAEEGVKLSKAMMPLLLFPLQHAIDTKQFSPSMTPIASRKLAFMRALIVQ